MRIDMASSESRALLVSFTAASPRIAKDSRPMIYEEIDRRESEESGRRGRGESEAASDLQFLQCQQTYAETVTGIYSRPGAIPPTSSDNAIRLVDVIAILIDGGGGCYAGKGYGTVLARRSV